MTECKQCDVRSMFLSTKFWKLFSFVPHLYKKLLKTKELNVSSSSFVQSLVANWPVIEKALSLSTEFGGIQFRALNNFLNKRGMSDWMPHWITKILYKIRSFLGWFDRRLLLIFFPCQFDSFIQWNVPHSSKNHQQIWSCFYYFNNKFQVK